MTTRILTVTAALLVALNAGIAPAATSFTEDFSGLALPANMVDQNSPPGVTSFAAANATFTGTRHYVATVETNFSLYSFVFEATMKFEAATDSNATAFMGMGPGTNGGAFNTPTTPNAYAEIGAAGFAAGFFRANDNGAQVGPLHGQGNGGWGLDTIHRVRMTWDVATMQATFQIDQNYTGTFAANFTQVLNGADNGFNATNSRLFFGGGNGTWWDDIVVSVVPTPAALPAGLAMLGLAAMRRRR